MNDREVYFKNKKILIYGFGKSGKSCFKFLKKNNNCTIFDDNKKNIPVKFKKKLTSIHKLQSVHFDFIVLQTTFLLSSRCTVY